MNTNQTNLRNPDGSLRVPIDMHLVNHGLCSHNLQELITKVEPFLPRFRHLVTLRKFAVETPLSRWQVSYQPDGRVGSFYVADERQTPVAEFVAVGCGDAGRPWRDCLQRCRTLHHAGLCPLPSLDETPPDTAAWIGLILCDAHSQLSADQKLEMDILVIGLAQAHIERALGYGLPIAENN